MKTLNKLIFKFLFFIFLVLNSVSSATVLGSATLKMCTNAEFPPFEFYEKGKIVGIDIEISQYIAQKLGCELLVEDGAFESLLINLQNGSCDFVAAGLTPTEERSKSVDFSVPYFNGSQRIIVRNDSNINGKNDLLNKKVGVQTGTTSEEYCKSSGLNIEVFCFSKSADAVQDLLAKQLDAVVVDGFAAEKFIASMKDKIHIIDEKLTEEDSCIAVKKGNKELLNKINNCILELKNSGELNKIIEKYYKVEVTSGEGDKETFFSKYKEYTPYLTKGLKNTLVMTILAVIIGIIIGIFIAFLKLLGKKKKFKILKILADIYTTVIRGTPVVVQLFILYYGILSIFNIDKILCASIAFGINSGAYVAEHIRSGIRSIDKGQMEAGLSLGLSYSHVMRYIILPQSFKNALPSLFGEFITLLRETAVVGYIGVMDLSKAGDIIKSRTYEALVPLLIVALIYLALTLIFTFFLKILEKKLHSKAHYCG